MAPVRRICVITLLLLVVFAVQPARAQNGAPLNGLDEFVDKAIKDWEVPGLAIAIVKDDKIVFAKGYGVRKLGEPTPVDEKTLFAIGSSSKAFTAAALAMLVDEGKVKWDDPVTKHLPGFELFDPYVTRELTVRDLLTHRSGLERGDMLWYGSEFGSRRDPETRALSQANVEPAQQLWLSELDVSGGWAAGRARERQELG